ncbi:MAG: hypothetical protein ACK5EA_22930 [Planctomycetaceae bacterium]|jgi:hypothetical protein
MHTAHKSGSVSVALLIIWIGSMGFIPEQDIVYGRERFTSGRKIGTADLARLLDEAGQELKAADLSQKEIRIRLKIVTNVATVKSYYPHVIGGPPETRNSNYWVENDEGSYVALGRPTAAIRDLWRTTSGIRCRKLSALVMLKSLIDVLDSKRLSELDDMLRDKVIPNDLPDDGIGTLFTKLDPKDGEVFQQEELLPDDEVWFDNPYFERLSEELQDQYRGQEGHHVFYVGGGKVMDMYSREPVPIEEFRDTFLRWGSVTTVA